MGAPQYEQAGADIGGTGTTNTIPRWTGPSTLGDSGLIDNGTAIYTTTRNVGIGTASPAYKLHIEGTSTNGALEVARLSNANSGSSATTELGFRTGTTDTQRAYVSAGYGPSDYNLSFGTTIAGVKTETMRLTQGNVGIGTASPASRLDVAGTITCDDAGTGLKLPATPGNTDPNTLDAYEDGGTAGTGGKTWTPTDTSGAGLTLTVTKAQYIRVGKQITFAFELTYPVTADATNAAISMPVTGITNWAASGVVYINTIGLRMWMISGGNLYFYTTAGVRMTNAQLSGLAVYGGSSYIAA